MSVYLTGDIHGDVSRFTSYTGLKKDDVVIVLGDFGVLWLWEGSTTVREAKEKPKLDVLDCLGCTVCFLDGNHENFDRLEALEIVKLFGAPAGKVTDHVYHLLRGEIYDIEGKSYFCMGGAASIDQDQRIEGVSWWPQENVTYSEMRYGLKNLAERKNKVDYILTHTPPQSILKLMLNKAQNTKRFRDPTAVMLDQLRETVSFKKWYFGHMHEDGIMNCDPRFVALFKEKIKIGGRSPKFLKKIV